MKGRVFMERCPRCGNTEIKGRISCPRCGVKFSEYGVERKSTAAPRHLEYTETVRIEPAGRAVCTSSVTDDKPKKGIASKILIIILCIYLFFNFIIPLIFIGFVSIFCSIADASYTQYNDNNEPIVEEYDNSYYYDDYSDSYYYDDY